MEYVQVFRYKRKEARQNDCLPEEAENTLQVVFSAAHVWDKDALMSKGKAGDTNCSITEKLCLPCAALNLSCPQKSATKGFTGLAAKQKDFNPP